VNNARQVQPLPFQVKKRKGPDPLPPVNGNTSTKRTKASEPGGLVRNWKPTLPLSEIARKHPIQFVKDEDDMEEGEFDKEEGQASLEAVRACKPSTVRIDARVDSRMVRVIIGTDCICLQLYCLYN
jgi:hypothetical protein